MTLTDDVVERSARAIYDAPDTQSGDTVGTVIWNSEHLFYDTVEGEEIVDTARRASMPTCRDAARAALEAARYGEMREALREAARTFRSYQRMHENKIEPKHENVPLDLLRKIERNKDLADRFDALLSTIGEPTDIGATQP